MNTAVDMGCFELEHGGISVSENQSPGPTLDERVGSPAPSPTTAMTMSAASKIGKNKSTKDNSQLSNCLSKVSSQIKKPTRRKTSPVNWFPRKKTDSFLERKIKMLQEVDGMNLTLDETLGDANPHYCRVLREKIAVREAAHKAMEAQKAALVEASWCRILRAARIQRKAAEALLEKAEKAAAEAVEAATAAGVIMYDKPSGHQKPPRIEMSSVKGGGFSTHTVTASFETAFEVDREVATAVKTALVRLASCPLFSKKDEFRDLLHKISQNPDEDDIRKELLEVSSECESESGSYFERGSSSSAFSTTLNLDTEKSAGGTRRRKFKRRQSLEKLTTEKIVDMMFERLKDLQENELSSLATIVAACGLNVALAKVESSKSHEPGGASDYPNNARRVSSCGVGSGRNYYLERLAKRSELESEIPSLDKFLVRHETRLEKEVREARDHRKKEAKDESAVVCKNGDRNVCSELPSLDKLVKRMSKLESEVHEAKASKTSMEGREGEEELGVVSDNATKLSEMTLSSSEVPSLDKVLVKHVSRLEREILEAKNRRKTELVGKENMNSNAADKEVREDSLDRVLVKPVHWLEREKQQALLSGSSYEYLKHQRKQGGDNTESLDKVLVKHVSRLEREKMKLKPDEFLPKAKTSEGNMHSQEGARGGLDQILVRHKSGLEKEKAASHLEPQEEVKVSMSRKQAREKELLDSWGGLGLGNSKSGLEKEKAASHLEPQEEVKVSVSRKQAREKELLDSWGGLGLGNSMRPHLSKLERDKAAWITAEEEERKTALKM